MVHALITVLAATEGEESSKTVFYVLGGALAVFALLVSAVGIRRHESFPPSNATQRAVMALAALLVFATMASAVLTA